VFPTPIPQFLLLTSFFLLLRILKSNKDEIISSFLSPRSPPTASIPVSSSVSAICFSSEETKAEPQHSLKAPSVSLAGSSVAPVPDGAVTNPSKSIKLLSFLKGPISSSSTTASTSSYSPTSEKNDSRQSLLSSLIEKPLASHHLTSFSLLNGAESGALSSAISSAEMSSSPPFPCVCSDGKTLSDPLLAAAVKGDQLLALISKTSSSTSRDSTSPSSSQASSIVNNPITSLEELQNQKGEIASVLGGKSSGNAFASIKMKPSSKESGNNQPALPAEVSSRSRGKRGNDVLLSLLTSAPATQSAVSPNSNNCNHQPIAKKLFPDASSLSSSADLRNVPPLNDIMIDHGSNRKPFNSSVFDSVDEINPGIPVTTNKAPYSPPLMPALISKQQTIKEVRLAPPSSASTTINCSSTSSSTKKPVLLISPSDLDI
jgi:hypothetical protein